MTLTHVVLLKWKPGTPDSAVEPGLKKLSQIPLTETYILSYRIGKDLDIGRTHMNHDIAVVAEFATEEDYRRYATSGRHLEAVSLAQAAPDESPRGADAREGMGDALSQRTTPSNQRVRRRAGVRRRARALARAPVTARPLQTPHGTGRGFTPFNLAGFFLRAAMPSRALTMPSTPPSDGRRRAIALSAMAWRLA